MSKMPIVCDASCFVRMLRLIVSTSHEKMLWYSQRAKLSIILTPIHPFNMTAKSRSPTLRCCQCSRTRVATRNKAIWNVIYLARLLAICKNLWNLRRTTPRPMTNILGNKFNVSTPKAQSNRAHSQKQHDNLQDLYYMDIIGTRFNFDAHALL